MSAVLERQASLAGIEPPPPLADVDLQVAIRGVLMQHAELRHGLDDSEQIHVLVEQRLKAHALARPVHAVRVYRDTGAPHVIHQIAHARAGRLRAGAEVVLLGRGLEPGHHEGQPVLRLIHLDAIKLASELQREISEGGAL